MEYKVGDRVFIKPWKLMEEEGCITGNEGCGVSCRWSKFMETSLKGTDRIITITEAYGGHYKGTHRLTSIFESNSFCDEHIAGLAFDYGEEIEIKQNSSCIHWVKERYVGFVNGSGVPYCTASPGATYCQSRKIVRKLQTPSIEITVKVNGEETKLSDISEETLLNIRKGTK